MGDLTEEEKENFDFVFDNIRAIHEAGHAIAGHCMGWDLTALKLKDPTAPVNNKEEWGGSYSGDIPKYSDTEDLDTVMALYSSLIVGLAGGIAQKHHYEMFLKEPDADPRDKEERQFRASVIYGDREDKVGVKKLLELLPEEMRSSVYRKARRTTWSLVRELYPLIVFISSRLVEEKELSRESLEGYIRLYEQHPEFFSELVETLDA